MLGHHPVHRVAEDDIGLAGGQPCLDQLLEQAARIDGAANRTVFRRFQFELGTVADRFHEFVGQQDAVMQVQGFPVKVAGRLSDFEKFFNFRMVDVEIASRRTATQGPLRNGQGQAVHHADERNDARCLAVQANRLADTPNAAPIGADAAAARGEPDIFVPGVDDAAEAVVDAVEIAADRQAATGAAVGQYRCRRHEPELGDRVIEPLGMLLIVGIGVGNAGEQILIGFAGQQIAVVERFLAEIGQQIIATLIQRDLEAALFDAVAVALRFQLLLVIGLGRGSFGSRLLADFRFADRFCVFGFAFWRIQYFRAHFTLTHFCSGLVFTVTVVSKIHQSPLKSHY